MKFRLRCLGFGFAVCGLRASSHEFLGVERKQVVHGLFVVFLGFGGVGLSSGFLFGGRLCGGAGGGGGLRLSGAQMAYC